VILPQAVHLQSIRAASGRCNIFHLADSGPFVTPRTCCGSATQGRICRYPSGDVGDRGLMFRDYPVLLRVGISLETGPGAQSQIPLGMTYAKFRGSRSLHLCSISFLWPTGPQISCPTYTCTVTDRPQPPRLFSASPRLSAASLPCPFHRRGSLCHAVMVE
jgi:hypothetical protein